MIALWTFIAMAFLCNWTLVSSWVLTPLKDDGSLTFFKEPPNGFEYMVKRTNIDERKKDVESKDRRSNMSHSSVIRFGRSQAFNNPIDNSAADSESADSNVNRHPRWKSPDIVIRFGRSNLKTNGEQLKRERNNNDLNFIRFGRNMQVVPTDFDLLAVCSAFMSNSMASDAALHPDVSRLYRLCNNFNRITGDVSLDTFEDQLDHRE